MGVRYNAEKKKIGNYYSTPIYSFRCKCHLCDNWFTIETDPKNTRYVVTSGARQKNEEWDPEENGGYAIHGVLFLCYPSHNMTRIDVSSLDPDKAGPSDPLAALEKTKQAQVHQNNVEVPRIEALQSLSEQYNADPYAHSLRVRKHFRIVKKLDKARKDADDSVRNKYALPEEFALVADDDAMKEEAREAFGKARRDYQADESARRRRMIAEVGTIRESGPMRSSLSGRPGKSAASIRTATASAAGASYSLRNRLLQNNVRKSDPFMRQDRSKPPDAKTLGINVKRS